MNGDKPKRDRENLLRDATALTDRMELKIAAYPETIVVGFRTSGAASFFFGEDPVFHFNSQYQLRRGFAGGLLYKADRGRLVSLRRNKTDTESQLIRNDLDDSQQQQFLAMVDRHLRLLAQALREESLTLVGQVSEDADLLATLAASLTRLSNIRIAELPHVS